jgi:endonuclease G
MRRLASARGAALVLALTLAAPAAAQPGRGAGPPPPTAPAGPPAQDPAAAARCLQRFKVIGLPVLRSEQAQAEQFPQIICRPGYALSFDLRTGNPDWVIERLTPAVLKGLAERRDNFAADPLLGAKSPTPDDYAHSGFDRGHQAPAADDKFSQPVMDETFYMSNMSPQVGIGFNRGQWKYLEEAVRAWVLCGGHDDVIVMTGPIYGDGAVVTIPVAAGAPRKIRVPAAYYKIVYDVKSTRAVGFRLNNQKHKKSDLQAFVTPIAAIEDETGIDFFPALARRKQNQIETPRGIVWGHEQACANISD